ncbi:hypothetical protein T484DRAFT_1820245 [Baffinella frigidus]|nr:hypothetical protein T484DRAFT_1820245 [Cryptophyta sp. CCMP2293]
MRNGFSMISSIAQEDPEDASAPLSVTLHVGFDVASALPRRVRGPLLDSSVDECVICLGVMAEGEEVTDLPGCYHTFHLHCVAQWLKTKVQTGRPGCCPACNASVVEPVFSKEWPAGMQAPPSTPNDDDTLYVSECTAQSHAISIVKKEGLM